MTFPRIRELREEHELTQEYMARKLHVSQRTYSRYETGERGLPIDVLIFFADLYNVSVDYILGLTDVRDRPSPRKKYPSNQHTESKVAD